MNESKDKLKRINGIDLARIICAVLVVAIHTSPLKDTDALIDSLLVSGLSTIAVPFFFMATGYFLADKFEGGIKQVLRKLKPYLINISKIYLLWSLIYLAFSINKLYSQFGQNIILTLLVYIRDFFLRGSAPHLWYFTSLLMALILMPFIMNIRKVKRRYALLAALFAIGLLGNSYYGIISEISILAKIKRIMDIFGTTRNGLFFALPFIYLGYYLKKKEFQLSRIATASLFILSTFLLIGETYLVYHFKLAFATNLYIFLLPAVVFFFLFSRDVLTSNVKGAYLRDISLGIYLVHPLISMLTKRYVESHLLNFIIIVIVSAALSIFYITVKNNCLKNNLKK